jgi:hypothetical protein
MCASEDFAHTDHRTVTVDLDVDDVLFDLDNDATLHELDAAHDELDRREKAVPRGTGSTYNIIAMVHDMNDTDTARSSAGSDAARRTASHPAPSARQAQLDAIAALRQTLSILHRDEVSAYAQTLRTAIEQRLAALPDIHGVVVTVAATTTYIRSAPQPVEDPAHNDVDEAIADAIAHTTTPGTLPGTLLCRAEAAHAERLGTQMKNCVARM